MKKKTFKMWKQQEINQILDYMGGNWKTLTVAEHDVLAERLDRTRSSVEGTTYQIGVHMGFINGKGPYSKKISSFVDKYFNNQLPTLPQGNDVVKISSSVLDQKIKKLDDHLAMSKKLMIDVITEAVNEKVKVELETVQDELDTLRRFKTKAQSSNLVSLIRDRLAS